MVLGVARLQRLGKLTRQIQASRCMVKCQVQVALVDIGQVQEIQAHLELVAEMARIHGDQLKFGLRAVDIHRASGPRLASRCP